MTGASVLLVLALVGVERVAGAETSAHGIVAVTGSDPFPRVVLSPDHGPQITLTGKQAHKVARLAGVEVRVVGRRTGASLTVERFLVLAVGGVPAVDGILVTRGGRYFLRISRRRVVPIRRLPRALHDQLGARIWLAGEGPDAFGIIDPPSR